MRNVLSILARRRGAVSVVGLVLVFSMVLAQIAPIYSSPNLERSMARQSQIPNIDVFRLDGNDGDLEGNAEGLQITLSEGSQPSESAQTLPVAETRPLSAAEQQPTLDRMPPLVMEEGDTQEFKLPPQSLPPPRTGQIVDETFPPTQEVAAPQTDPAGPLEVLRYAPEGEIRIAPFLNVTFNQPMAPLSTVEALSNQEVPVQLTPELPGVWKWLGVKTLSFEYESDLIDRFPMATEYVATVPAGVESVVGGVLAEAVTWTFRTPPPRVRMSHPGYGPQPLDPLLFVAFDQRVDPQAVLATIRVSAGGQDYPVRLASEEEIANDTSVQRLAENSLEDRWLAFRAERSFPANTTVNVNIGPKTPSAEGPLTTPDVQSFSFQTYAPLRIDRHQCGWSNQCPPYSPFEIIFNNPIDEEMFEESLIQVDPAIPGMIVEMFGNTLSVRGATAGRTTYRVTVEGSIQDIFGQKLGDQQTLAFETGPAPSFFSGPQGDLITLDPTFSQPLFPIYSVNYERLRVRAYAVQPEDWPAYQSYKREYYRTDTPPEPPGQQVISKIFTIDSQPDQLVETNIDLGAGLDGDTGHLIVIVDFPPNPLLRQAPYNEYRVESWVQVTQLGLDAFIDHSEMVAWTTALVDGAPLADVTVELMDADVVGQTGADGLVSLDLPALGSPLLIATLGEDRAILPGSSYFWDETGWQSRPVSDELRWYLFDDRQMYRPGEEVHVKGWTRQVGGKQDGDLSLPAPGGSVRYQVMGSQGNELASGVAEMSDLAGFDFVFTLPENANLGYAQIFLTAQSVGGIENTNYYHSFQIQEFRRPEFEVTARNDQEGPFFVGDETTVSVAARYFAGGPLPNAATNWNITSSPGSYSPPNWPDFVFGEWIPWWGYSDYFGYQDGGSYANFTGKTDAAGVHYLRMSFDAATEPRPYSVRAEAVVEDVNRQAWASSTNLLVHPAELYVGIHSDRTFVESGVPLEIDAIVTDLDGNALPGRTIQMQAARLEWKYEKGEWREEEVDVQECSVQSEAEPVTCSFETPMGGEYRITATVEDDQGRANLSRFQRWVSGGKRPPARNVELEQVTLIPDQESHQPGDVAEILVQAPFVPAEGLLTVSRSGMLYSERFTMQESTYTLRVPVEEAHIPNLNIQVDLTGSTPRTDDAGEPIAGVPPRPAFASGALNLTIPPLSRTLALEVSPQAAELEPGAETAIAIQVTDAAGDPVAGAEVAVVVVDEAILALTNYQLADPVATFYQERGADLRATYGRSSIVLASPDDLLLQVQAKAEETLARGGTMMQLSAAAPMATPAMDMVAESAAMDEASDGDAGGDSASSIEVRSDFNPLAAFIPAATTDTEGRALAQVKLPDNLTRYRVMVVAVAGGKYFGSGESNVTARLPLMIRPSAPRFLNFGDYVELPIVVQNQTDEPMEVDVVLKSANLLLTDGSGQRVSVPANDRVEVRFPASTVSAGTARLQVAAVSGAFADGAEIELPVYTPATTEAFATYGVVDDGAIVQPVAAPVDVFPQFGGLDINTSSTALQALTDAVLYLTSYPFECSEQLASRILGVAALRDVLTAFEAEGLPSPDEMEAAVTRDIERLQQMQNWDGGFPIWRKGQKSIPFYSIHVAHALQRAQEKGFLVPDEMQLRVLDHLREIERFYEGYYSPMARQTLSAYALYVRQLMGDVDTVKARKVYAEIPLDDQSLEATAWLWQVLSGDPASVKEVDAIRRHINNQAVETAGAANFTVSYGEDAYLLLHSNRRTDAIILDALINDDPENDLIPKVVNGLLAHRTAGRWNNTQENVFVLVALDRYFNTFEAVTPDFVARIWLGETYAGEHEFVGRSTDTRVTSIPMTYLVDPALGGGETQDLILSKEGDGRLYYRLGLRYAPDDLTLEPLDMGFVVQRVYEPVDDPDDVVQDDDGTWRIKAGARVRVRLTMVAQNRRYHVALVDPLPAGLEIVNPALAVSESIPDDPTADENYGWWWWGPWYDHQNMRDARAEAFTTLLWDGVYHYDYVARATTPGTFVVPPAKAEEMYSPEVFGRSGTDRVIVE